MSTIQYPRIIKQMLENDGTYPGDPRMHRIYRYTGVEDETLYAIFMSPELDDMYQSPYVRNPVLLFDADLGGLTPEGEQELKHLKKHLLY